MLSQELGAEDEGILNESKENIGNTYSTYGSMGTRLKIDECDGYGPIVSFVFTVNFLVDAGLLGLPYAFSKAGILASIFFLILIMIIGCITMSWMVEVQGILTGLIESRGGLHSSPNWEIKNYKVEVSEMVEYFLGYSWKRVYIAALFFFTEGALWVYTVVFAASMVTRLGFPGITDGYNCDLYDQFSDFGSNADQSSDGYESCQNGYYLYVILYGSLMCFMVLRDLKAQVGVQMTLTGLALSIMLVMIFTTIMAIGNGAYPLEKDSTKNDGAFEGNETNSSDNLGEYDLVNFGGIGYIFSAAVFAMLAHHGAPGVTRLCADKTKVRTVFISAMVTTVLFYISLGTISVIYFGNEGIKELVTLNWKNYEDYSGVSGGFSNFVSYVVVLFPCSIVSCAFPLYAVTLSNNISSDVPKRVKKIFGEKLFDTLLRLVIAFIPLIGGMFLRDPAILVNFTGIFGFFIMFFFPALLQYHSKKYVAIFIGEEYVTTPYTWHFSHEYYVFGISLLSLIGFIITIVLSFQNI